MRTARLAGSLLVVGVSLSILLPSRARAAEPTPATFTFDSAGPGTKVVIDPAAAAKQTLAVDVSTVTGSFRLKSASQRLDAGSYRVTLFARMYSTAGDDFSRLQLEFTVGDSKSARLKKRLVWTQFDSTPDRYTPLEFDLVVPGGLSPVFDISWLQLVGSPLEKVKPMRRKETPNAPQMDRIAPKKRIAGDDDLLAEIATANKLPALSTVDYPAILLDRVTFEPVSKTQLIETVHPRYVHIYPQQSNPIAVTLRNFTREPVNAVAQLAITAGLDEVQHTATQSVKLAPSTTTSCTFDWKAGAREYGYEARVTLLVDGQPVHARSDYFSVSYPIWKTALQASGFLDWFYREKQIPEHVSQNRANYCNVEEAFSWQPSSWTNLTPDGDHWWAGQNDFHNSLNGLKLWLGLSHDEGIKMITYLWPSASGPEGLEWARRSPELVTHGAAGLPSEFLDVEDLRLKPITEANPKLWRLRSGIWNNVGVNRGMLRAIEKGVSEAIESSRRYGWDGARFDSPPGWSAMGAADMHSEFAHLKVESLMKRLVPEYYDQTAGQWNDQAVSVCNVRYARHRFNEHDPRFATSYNFSGEAQRVAVGGESKFFDECCLNGGQIMDEEIRQFNQAPWRVYLDRIKVQADAIRRRGGHHCVFPVGSSPVSRCYAGIFTFAGGSHPYQDYGWNLAMPGLYTQFMTRYGEYCWGTDLDLVAADAAGFAIADDETLWWRDLVRQRKLPDGRTQWTLQLIAAPPAEKVTPEKPGTMQPWRRALAIARTTSHEPSVWALTAEPTTTATRLEPRKTGDRYTVEIPEHRLWTVLVWTEPTR